MNLLRTLIPTIINVCPYLVAPFDAFFHTGAELLVTHFVADIGPFRLKIDVAVD